MAPRIMWIGLGNMGRGMCKNLVEKGGLDKPLLLYNRTRKRCEDLQSQLPPGTIEVVDSVEIGVSGADIIFTCIADDTAVQATIDAGLSGDVKGKTFVDCSTIHPDTTNTIASLVCARGAAFVSAPVFGAPPMADAGQLVAVLAGPRSSVDRVRPYFKGVTSRAEIDLSGDDDGDDGAAAYSRASTLKVIGNTFVFSLVEQLAEGLVLAERSGLGTEPLKRFVEAMLPGPYVGYANRMLDGDYHTRTEPLFAVDLARKDIRHARSLAEKAGVKLHNMEPADAHLAMVKDISGASGDVAGIYGAVRKEAGLRYENGE